MSIAGDSSTGDRIAAWASRRLSAQRHPGITHCDGQYDDAAVLQHFRVTRGDVHYDLYFGYPGLEGDQLTLTAVWWYLAQRPDDLHYMHHHLTFQASLGDPGLFDRLDAWLTHALTIM